MTILIQLIALNRNKNAKLYLSSPFQPNMYRAQSLPKFKLNIYLTKSPKRDHIYILCLYMLEEHNCLILTS